MAAKKQINVAVSDAIWERLMAVSAGLGGVSVGSLLFALAEKGSKGWTDFNLPIAMTARLHKGRSDRQAHNRELAAMMKTVREQAIRETVEQLTLPADYTDGLDFGETGN